MIQAAGCMRLTHKQQAARSHDLGPQVLGSGSLHKVLWLSERGP